ncbi:MAG: hypothetical protein CMI26_11675 [Opitutae bacterium]|nr:hypothetical protein [Opitutae bacterium]|tara:strand:+ start:7395 stop:8333 length:939 start_codon:yes stop_codon:yes gene_type:complete
MSSKEILQDILSTFPKGFLDPNSVPSKVQGFDVKDGAMCKNASWQGIAAQIALPPLSAEENMMRKEKKDQTIHFPPSFGGKEKEHLPLEARKETVNSTKFAMRLVRDSVHHQRLKVLDDAICYAVARAAIASGKAPFKKDDDVHAIRGKITCILKDNNPEEYAPVAEMVIKKVPDINHKDQEFSLGYTTKNYNTDGRRGLKVDKKNPTFGWRNLEEHLKKGAAVHHAFGYLDYASLFVKNKKLDSMHIQFQLRCITLGPDDKPVDQMIPGLENVSDDDEEGDEEDGEEGEEEAVERPLKRVKEGETAGEHSD